MNRTSLINAYASLPGGIAVLCGGPGGEREVSLESGSQAQAALSRAGVPARRVTVPEREPEAFLEALDCALAVPMLHGDFGEDGAAQAILERRGIPFSGSGSAACRLSMDKTATKDVMRRIGLPTPKSVLLTTAAGAAEAVAGAGIPYPLFVRPNAEGSSVGASRVENEDELPNAVENALATGDRALVEELIAGRELTIGWFAGKILPPVEMIAAAAFYDYDAKYRSNDTRYVCPADIPAGTAEKISAGAARLVEALGMRDIARVDVMLGAGGPMFLEANALPGFTAHSLLPMAASAAGVGMEELCVSLVAMAAERGAAAHGGEAS